MLETRFKEKKVKRKNKEKKVPNLGERGEAVS